VCCWARRCARWGCGRAGSRPGRRRGLDGRTIKWETFEEQPGDADPTPFSFRTKKIVQPQVSCHIAFTTPETLRIIREMCTVGDVFGTDRRDRGRAIARRSKTRSSSSDKTQQPVFSGAGGAGIRTRFM